MSAWGCIHTGVGTRVRSDRDRSWGFAGLVHLRIDTHTFALRAIGLLVAVVGFILILVALLERSPIPALPGLAALIAGFWLARSNGLLVRRPLETVVVCVERTLSLMSVRHSRKGNRLLVAATDTVIDVRRVWMVSLVTFAFTEGGSTREKYIRDTVIKFQRIDAQD